MRLVPCRTPCWPPLPGIGVPTLFSGTSPRWVRRIGPHPNPPRGGGGNPVALDLERFSLIRPRSPPPAWGVVVGGWGFCHGSSIQTAGISARLIWSVRSIFDRHRRSGGDIPLSVALSPAGYEIHTSFSPRVFISQRPCVADAAGTHCRGRSPTAGRRLSVGGLHFMARPLLRSSLARTSTMRPPGGRSGAARRRFAP